MRFITLLPFDFDPFDGIGQAVHSLERSLVPPAARSVVPAYDIVRVSDERTELRFAVAGYELSELDIHVERGILTVAGAKKPAAEVSFIRRGIAQATFERRFELAEQVTVEGAALVNGILTIQLRTEKPASDRRKVEIKAAA